VYEEEGTVLREGEALERDRVMLKLCAGNVHNCTTPWATVRIS
jgi:hypothetical protein